MSRKPINKLLFDPPSVLSGAESEVSRKDFEFERRLGDGAFGQVWRVKNKQTQKTFAMKQVPKEKVTKMLGQFRREVFIMYELSHPHIIKLFTHFEDEKFFYLIMELADGGNLFHKLYREKCFLERNAAQYFREVVLAVEYLHSHVPAIIHRDIKPENILLDKDGRIKLTDFGWSNYYSEDNPTLRFTMCGTLEYLPPEIVSEKGHNTGADVWCLGILLFEMLTGSTPFNSKGKDQMMSNILSLKPKFPHSMPPLAKDLIAKMIEKDPVRRLSAKEIKNHPWLLEHPPIRETITQDCAPKLLPSLEDLNKAMMNKPPESKPLPKTTKNVEASKFEFDDDNVKNNDNGKPNLDYTKNDFRMSVVKLKQQVSVKSDDNQKIRQDILDMAWSIQEQTLKMKFMEESISHKRKDLNLLTTLERELLLNLSDANIELERMNHINLSAITEKITSKNSELLSKITQLKQLKSKHENLRGNSLKIVQELQEKEKNLSSLSTDLKKIKENLILSNSGKKSELSELETSAEILKSRLGCGDSFKKLGRFETSAANDIMKLIKEENQKLGTLLRPKLEKQCNELEERVNEKEQELAEAKISFEEIRSNIMQKGRVRKDEIVRNRKKKAENLKIFINGKVDDEVKTFKNRLNLARKEENRFYVENSEIHSARERIKVRSN
jgi:serine/threonine protein kinase